VYNGNAHHAAGKRFAVNDSYYLILNNLNADETKIVTSIISHIEKGHRKIGVMQIANENFVSTAFIIRLCKKLGFDGYSELFYYLLKPRPATAAKGDFCSPQTLIYNYSNENFRRFSEYLTQYKNRHAFVTGEGFANFVSDYMVQRLAICGFMIFNGVHFYDFMMFRDHLRNALKGNIEPSFMIAISQSGESKPVIEDAHRAKEHGFRLISFTRMETSTLADMSDVVFTVDPAKQNLIGRMPNLFFGKVVLAFEQMVAMHLGEAAGASPDTNHL
jgi:DNA-binding MurR/RpiR family transcriptional regulator